ncbi:hypothetical protein Y1Q_0014459 [Alligator mississippiensis]|nr:hypothetical protein Y1Q_0014459 [Alligator mississippiensis]
MGGLDISNAFSSMLHRHILGTLRELSLPDGVVNPVQELYDRCTMTVRNTDRDTNKIPIQSEVRQGCPLSPTIFNLAMEPLLQAMAGGPSGLNLYSQKLNVLAYANDLVLLTNDAAQLQQMLDMASEAARWMGLCFNITKYTSLHINGRQKSHVLDSTLMIQGQAMRHLHDSKAYCHLGMPTGHQTR